MRSPEEIRKKLASLADPTYRDFQTKLIPTIDKESVLGVRMPVLRRFAKTLTPEESAAFRAALPHRYYDENNLHATLIERLRDFDEAVAALEAFLPLVDNWATCDMMRPKCLSKKPEVLAEKIEGWLKSDHAYTVRYGIGLLLSFYLGDHFSPFLLEKVASLDREEYYIRMMAAWFFATALVNHEKEVLPYLIEERLDPTVQKMTIRKACESFRIPDATKKMLRALPPR